MRTLCNCRDDKINAMKNIITGCIVIIGIIGCAAPIKEFYPDTFYEEDSIYQNKALGFNLKFQDDWYIFTDPNKMDKPIRALALELNRDASELLFVGAATDGLQGVRGIAAHLNASAAEYAKAYYQLNKQDICEDSGLVEVTIKNLPVVIWEYSKKNGQSKVRFIEFFFALRSYTIRIAFWADPRIFVRFLPVYFDTMTSLEIVEKF